MRSFYFLRKAKSIRQTYCNSSDALLESFYGCASCGLIPPSLCRCTFNIFLYCISYTAKIPHSWPTEVDLREILWEGKSIYGQQTGSLWTTDLNKQTVNIRTLLNRIKQNSKRALNIRAFALAAPKRSWYKKGKQWNARKKEEEERLNKKPFCCRLRLLLRGDPDHGRRSIPTQKKNVIVIFRREQKAYMKR